MKRSNNNSLIKLIDYINRFASKRIIRCNPLSEGGNDPVN